MKDSFTIAIIVAAAAALAFRLYRKYYNKNTGPKKSDINKGSSLTSSSKDDEYEPYSKK